MNIPAKVVVAKMEEELEKLKASLLKEEAGGTSSYREQAAVMKTYCDLLLASDQKIPSTKPVNPIVKHASAADLEKDSETISPKQKTQKERLSVYDPDEEPKSDSLLDF